MKKAPLLQLVYANDGGGRVQILTHALSFARGVRNKEGAHDHAHGSGDHHPGSTVWQLMFPYAAALEPSWSFLPPSLTSLTGCGDCSQV